MVGPGKHCQGVVMCGRIWTPPDCSDFVRSGSEVAIADVNPASVSGLLAKPPSSSNSITIAEGIQKPVAGVEQDSRTIKSPCSNAFSVGIFRVGKKSRRCVIAISPI
jgi:hypothetical protein